MVRPAPPARRPFGSRVLGDGRTVRPGAAPRAIETRACNVVVAERDGGGSVVSAMDPEAAFQLIDNPRVQPVADEVSRRLRRVLGRLT
jgi:hypothetical protein